METFRGYAWPGNVRELKNAAERTLYRWVAADRSGPVDAAFIDPFADARLPADTAETAPVSGGAPSGRAPAPQQPDGPFDLRKALDAVERRWTLDALITNGWSQKRAAGHLALTYDQMRGLVRKHDLKAPD